MTRHKGSKNKATKKRQEHFVSEYVKDFNATRAAKATGYSEHSAHATGFRLINDAEVKAKIEAKVKENLRKNDVTAENVIRELSHVAFLDMKEVADWTPDGVNLRHSGDLEQSVTRALSEVSESRNQSGSNVKVKAHDKLKALELLGRYLGIWKDSLEVKTPEPIIITRPSDGSVIELTHAKKQIEGKETPDVQDQEETR